MNVDVDSLGLARSGLERLETPLTDRRLRGLVGLVLRGGSFRGVLGVSFTLLLSFGTLSFSRCGGGERRINGGDQRLKIGEANREEGTHVTHFERFWIEDKRVEEGIRVDARSTTRRLRSRRNDADGKLFL